MEVQGDAFNPLVSIIMPAYNSGKYIAEAIRSVRGQTYPDWELVVVDDGSTDETAGVVQNISRADARVKYIFQQNGGQGKARNTGLRHASGDLVAFLDSDDLWVRNKLELQVKVLRREGADLVFSDGFVFEGDDAEDESRTFGTIRGRYAGAEMLRLLLITNRIPILSVLARRGCIEGAGLFSEEREYQNCEDYELWMRLARRGAVFFGMGEKLVRYRRHPASSTYCDSKALKPMVAVVKAHIHEGGLGELEARMRVRGLYRDLIAALLEEGKLGEARENMKEFSGWDRGGVLTLLQRLLINVVPRRFNVISRKYLYRAECHIQYRYGKYVRI
jgi:teichuronic acid biosynthesis glycosyltransferase TuaG